MLKRIEPFCLKESDAFQYLYDLDNPIDFIFSAGKELTSDEGIVKDAY